MAPVPARSLVKALRLHPRVAFQGVFGDEGDRVRIVERFPELVPFRRAYDGALAIIDWDHLLPSKRYPVRLQLYYDGGSLAAGEHALQARLAEIAARDRFPEFDVPDLQDLPADETYEAMLDENGVSSWRLTSAWRRDISGDDARAAIDVARASTEFARVATVASPRPRYLGDLDAVSWTPPCESGYPRWTMDVWYLLAFDGRVGSGRSLLVDLDGKQVVTSRDFSVRTG